MDEKKKTQDLLDVHEDPKKLVKMRCTGCGQEGEPTKWLFRTIAGVLLFLGGIFPGIIYFTSTNPYVCSKCGERDKLVKILNDRSESKVESGGKGKFMLITIVVLAALVAANVARFSEGLAFRETEKAIELYQSGGDPEEAAKMMEDSIGGLGDDESKMESYKNIAYVYSNEENYDLSIENFEKALEYTRVGDYNYYLINGEIDLMELEIDSAFENYNKALDVRYTDFQIHNALGLFYLDMYEIAPDYVDYEKALEHFELADKWDLDEQLFIVENKAITQIFLEDYDSAIEYFSGADLANNGYSHFWLAFAYYGKEDVEKGDEHFLRAIELNPEIAAEIMAMEVEDY
jgi:Tfp pilus assembly protein PilF